ncbi:3-deoxy-D-manno-octulosonic acid transferase [Saccharobesus litoralis]|uniref:3-deoxy-D-manno-octulosonic acid transferase n=1 Tax=Saccharobesus litoralis TaxID=2172099 RepID=A0A2S0VVM4_9ALTE|nr:lipid IV(A) 3-deoxy-D-manno-octulosonic acid transferase [Saccharobesus litoralis]AWB68258.1 3-deoxy-D-manno-octulosonic acid transferase [Saccharobesus litoralis]
MVHFLYNQLLRVLLPLIILKLKRKAKKSPAYGARLDERKGNGVIDIPKGCVIFHLASLGETISATPLIKAFQQANPTTPVLLTSTTPTGSEQIQKTFGNRVYHCYLPYDLPIIQRRFICKLEPAMLVLMETELWPNLIFNVKRYGGQVVVINARMSDKSAKGYARLGPLTRTMLKQVDLVLAQFDADATRFMELGCDAASINVIGNLKFDTQFATSQQQAAKQLQQKLNIQRPVWLAASTHKGEEEQILAAHKTLLNSHPNALLVLVPRHPERFGSVSQLSQQSFITQVKSSLKGSLNLNTQVLIGDTLGEMMSYICLADMVFIGGSLVERGGHNPFEAACQHKVILTGTHTFNFAESFNILQQAQALLRVQNSQQLANQLNSLMANETLKATYAQNAYLCQQQCKGALNSTLDLLNQHYQNAIAQQSNLSVPCTQFSLKTIHE